MNSGPAHRVSVAICTYNGAAYIVEQIRSILEQSRPVDEIVLADDGSSDDTVALVRAEVARTPGAPDLVVLPGDRPRGVTANFERAMLACTGQVIVLSDQDDRWHPDRVALGLDVLDRRPEVALVFADATLIDGSGADLGASLFEALEIPAAELAALRGDGAFSTLLRRNLVTGATAMVRRELVERAAPFDRDWLHDEWLAIIAAATARLEWVPERLIGYRQHGANQVGVAVPSLRYKISRLVAPRGDRTRHLARRAAALAARLDALDVPSSVTELARAKRDFEAARAALPALRIARIAPVLRIARSGRYARFASRGSADIVRDLVQSGR